jgi:hypothetical protein
MTQKLLNTSLLLLGAAVGCFVWEIVQIKRRKTMPTINIQHVSGHNNNVNGSGDWKQNANYPIDPSAIAEVHAMLDEIRSAVTGIAPEQQAKSQNIFQASQQLQKAIDTPNPNRHEIHLSAKGLEEAAQTLATIVPIASNIASNIVKMLFPY